jgi:hypothetical protein
MSVVTGNFERRHPRLSPAEAIACALRMRMSDEDAADIADDAVQALATVGWAMVPRLAVSASEDRPGGPR